MCLNIAMSYTDMAKCNLTSKTGFFNDISKRYKFLPGTKRSAVCTD